ncbi:hypothetical protein [Acinetobacter sp. KS-LM10]|uniref:hypothetical protein n=1 Tax=Acinetobacter sp. KS-LM10 TaxID=3120518 RepID=UPI0030D49E6C
MNFQFQNKPEFQQRQNVQSFYEPALKLLDEMLERNKANLRSKGYDENNAAISKNAFKELLVYRMRISQWLAQEVISSLIKSAAVDSFGSFIKPKASEVKP